MSIVSDFPELQWPGAGFGRPAERQAPLGDSTPPARWFNAKPFGLFPQLQLSPPSNPHNPL